MASSQILQQFFAVPRLKKTKEHSSFWSRCWAIFSGSSNVSSLLYIDCAFKSSTFANTNYYNVYWFCFVICAKTIQLLSLMLSLFYSRSTTETQLNNLFQMDSVSYKRPEARFSKVPKLFGHVSGDLILFVSSKRRDLEARNLAAISIFVLVTTYEKSSFTE